MILTVNKKDIISHFARRLIRFWPYVVPPNLEAALLHLNTKLDDLFENKDGLGYISMEQSDLRASLMDIFNDPVFLEYNKPEDGTESTNEHIFLVATAEGIVVSLREELYVSHFGR